MNNKALNQSNSDQSIVQSNADKICQIVLMIPAGYVASYGQVADLAGLPGRARLVSRALKSAPASINLPWHRVVNSQNKLSFDRFSALYQTQKSRLQLEGVVFNGQTIAQAHRWQPSLSTILQMPF